MPSESVDLLGMIFDNLGPAEVVSELFARPRAAHFAYLVTPNADHLTRLKRHPHLRRIYEAAWMCVLDSRAIFNLACWLGLPAPAVATGVDITHELLSAMSPQPVAVIGVSAAAMAHLRAKYRKLSFIHHQPPQNLINHELGFRRARDFAVQTNARFTFLALGSPLQEMLAFEIASQPTATGTGLCIGAALDYCAGTTGRAPRLMRLAGLEWLYRLIREPVRLWRRYLIDSPPVIRALLQEKFARSSPGQAPQTAPSAMPAAGPYRPERRARLQKILDEQ